MNKFLSQSTIKIGLCAEAIASNSLTARDESIMGYRVRCTLRIVNCELQFLP